MLLIPHELLHVLAYRLVGKPCAYRLGERCVTDRAPLSPTEELIVLLFPLAMTWGLALLAGLLVFATFVWVILPHPPLSRSYRDVPRWHWGLVGLTWLLFVYGGAALGDIRAAWRLLREN